MPVGYENPTMTRIQSMEIGVAIARELQQELALVAAMGQVPDQTGQERSIGSLQSIRGLE